jgi:hypothetical protein
MLLFRHLCKQQSVFQAILSSLPLQAATVPHLHPQELQSHAAAPRKSSSKAVKYNTLLILERLQNTQRALAQS